MKQINIDNLLITTVVFATAFIVYLLLNELQPIKQRDISGIIFVLSLAMHHTNVSYFPLKSSSKLPSLVLLSVYIQNLFLRNKLLA